MSAIEQFIAGLVDERLDRGARAVSWLLGCAYILTLAWLPSHDIDATAAIEASAVIGAFRGFYILWMKYVSRSHRLHSLHGLIGRCGSIMDFDEDGDSEYLVSMLVLRDKLARLQLGLPKVVSPAALEALKAYSKEKQWDLASRQFPIARYGHTKEDRRESVALIEARHARSVSKWDDTLERVVSELKAHERAMALARSVRLIIAVVVTTAIVVLVFLRDQWLPATSEMSGLALYGLIAGGAVIGILYAWALGRSYSRALSRRARRRRLREKESGAEAASDE